MPFALYTSFGGIFQGRDEAVEGGGREGEWKEERVVQESG